jgi:flagellin FlaB
MLKGLYKGLRRDERGITGLETAIILIAFVVVASVFAYTVLSAGIFSSQKGQEAVYSGLAEAQATMDVKGSMFAYGTGTAGNMTVDAVSFTLTNAMQGQAIDLTPDTGNGTAVTIISYTDKNQHVSELPWTVTFIGKHDNNDNLLEQDKQAVIMVSLSTLSPPPGIYDTFTIEVKPVTGAALILNRTLPARIDQVMDLH